MKDVTALLTQFGLTEYEAKTLSTLFRLSEAQAPEISRHAQVPKTRVYDVLEKLMAKKMVIEINGRPKKYRVVSADQTFAQLLDEKKAQLSALQTQAQSLAQELSRPPQENASETEQVLKVKDQTDFFKILGHEIAQATQEVLCLTTQGDRLLAVSQNLAAAAQKNVSVRILHHDHPSEEWAGLLPQSAVKSKKAAHGVNAFVIDNKKVVLFLSDPNAQKAEYHFTIWPDNKHMASLISHYFDHHWEKDGV